MGKSKMMRIGIGYDIHPLVKNRKLILGGVEIPYAKGLKGHSDADVLLHAVCDGLLGALGKGDIGEHFPNTDPKYKNISSLKLLEKVGVLVKAAEMKIGNIDTVVIAQEPNIKKDKPLMQSAIAKVLKIKSSQVNIKATTNEGLGSIGRKEGIAAYAVVLLTER